MKPDVDEALRAALAEAHRHDEAKMPSFERVWKEAGQGPVQHPSPLPWLMTCASLAGALGLAAWLIGQLGPPPAQFPGGTRWNGPTDFLLETPGLVTLRTVPEFPDAAPRPESRTLRGNP